MSGSPQVIDQLRGLPDARERDVRDLWEQLPDLPGRLLTRGVLRPPRRPGPQSPSAGMGLLEVTRRPPQLQQA